MRLLETEDIVPEMKSTRTDRRGREKKKKEKDPER